MSIDLLDIEPSGPSGPFHAKRRIRVGLYGASGPVGTELVRLILGHPQCALAFATSRQLAGQSLRAVDPAAPDVCLSHPDQVEPCQVDIAFICLPHGQAAGLVERCFEATTRVVVTSGDFRLQDPALHATWYGSERRQTLLSHTVYGLTEAARADVATAAIVSNPGCVPTAVGLALWPLAAAGAIQGPVIVNALSGVSGAGRALSATNHFCAVNGDVAPYLLGRRHRHVVETEQCLAGWMPAGGGGPTVLINPHVVPIERGLLATIVVPVERPSATAIRQLYDARYGAEPFVDVLPAGDGARIRHVVRTNRCAIGIELLEDSGHIVVTSAIDNLLKGAAGQAVQNMNVMCGLPDEAGLTPATAEMVIRSAPLAGEPVA